MSNDKVTGLKERTRNFAIEVIRFCAGLPRTQEFANRRKTVDEEREIPRWRPVHPRVCGEHDIARIRRMLEAGSSPRVRGTSIQSRCMNSDSRFIPACAGNMRCVPRIARLPPVHPRVCGEHALTIYTRDYFRFIPACVGNIWELPTKN